MVLTMSSSSNRDAIKNVKWLDDSESLAFIRENPAELSQVYLFKIQTRLLIKMTAHPTAVTDYDILGNGDPDLRR